MIKGIGIDIVSVCRLEKILDDYGMRFARKVLAQNELEEYLTNQYPARFLAKRFAAKEAMVKAMGTGFRNGIHLNHISVTHGSAGQPEIQCVKRAYEYLSSTGASSIFLSLSDEENYACAVVVLE